MDDGGVIGFGAQQDPTTVFGFNNITASAKLSDVAIVSVGGSHAVAVLRNNTVRNWGNTPEINARLDSSGPPTAFGAIKQIVAGEHYNVALFEDGTVRAWSFDEGAETLNEAASKLRGSMWISSSMFRKDYAVTINKTAVLLNQYVPANDPDKPPKALKGKVVKVHAGSTFTTAQLVNGSWRACTDQHGNFRISDTPWTWFQAVSTTHFPSLFSKTGRSEDSRTRQRGRAGQLGSDRAGLAVYLPGKLGRMESLVKR